MARADSTDPNRLIKRIDALERELERIRRDLMHTLAASPPSPSASKPTLFGSVRGGDVTEGLIEDAKQAVFRSLNDL